jgi:hypothetical protein
MGEGAFAGTRGNDKVAPKTDLRMLAGERVKAIPYSHSRPAASAIGP